MVRVWAWVRVPLSPSCRFADRIRVRVRVRVRVRDEGQGQG